MRFHLLTITVLISFAASPQRTLQGAGFPRDYAYAETPSPLSNPAALAKANDLSVIMQAEQVYMLFPTVLMSAIIPAGAGSFRGVLEYSGSSTHSQMQAALGYGRKLNDRISVGLQFGLFQTRIPGYVKSAEGSVAGGIMIRLNDKLVTGMDIRKPVRFAGGEKLVRGVYRAGLGYTVSPLLLIGIEIEKEDDEGSCFRGALEYKFSTDLFASLGFATGTSTWFFGSGVSFHTYRVEARFSKHPFLGWSPSVLLAFNKKNKTNETR